MTATTTRRVNGAHVFSAKTRRRILSVLRDKALAGCPDSAALILKYGMPDGAERTVASSLQKQDAP
jgi:hypothetical protein